MHAWLAFIFTCAVSAAPCSEATAYRTQTLAVRAGNAEECKQAARIQSGLAREESLKAYRRVAIQCRRAAGAE